MAQKEKSILHFFTRLLAWLLLVVVLVIIALALFINYKKNDLANRLLEHANTSIQGEITVGSISVGRLLDYPVLQVDLHDVAAYACKQADTTTTPFITVSKISVAANLNDILEGEYLLNSVELAGGTLKINRSEKGDLDIRTGFKPIMPIVRDSLSGNTSSFLLAIDTIFLSDYTVLVQDARFEPELNARIDSLHANFVYQKSTINGLAMAYGHTERIELDSVSSIATAPLGLQAAYKVNLANKTVDVETSALSLFYTPLYTSLHYSYGEVDELELLLNSEGNGLSLKSQNFSDTTDLEFALLDGFLDMRLLLNWKQDNQKPFYDQIQAKLMLKGTNITVEGIDLDNYINKFQRSQNFNLLDLGAVMLAGPAGIAITKGTDYTLLLTTGQGDSSEIKNLVANWQIANGHLTATDLAFNTQNNLVAANCDYAMATDSLDMKIMVIDKRGCTMVSQNIYGKGEKLKSDRVKVIKTLLGPVTNFFRDIGLGKCDQEYLGTVKHPHAKPKKKKKSKNKKKDKKSS